VINNNVAKTVGAMAHSIAFPTDMTDKVVAKANAHNNLTYFWLQLPVTMSFKNLPKSYTLSIQLVRCIPLENLCENILQRELQCIKKANHDSDIEIEDVGLMTTRHRVSLTCPITQALIIVPAKSSFCSHLTCFDLRSFLQMNQRRLQWTCPLCKKPASYETLHVDKRLKAILANVPAHCSTVEIDTSAKNLSECQYILDHVKQERGVHGDDDDDSDDEQEAGSVQNTSTSKL
jgi:E3 SUMO-protein ligase PIAS1